MREALSWCPECIWFSVNSSDFICFGEICFRCLVSFLITPVILLQEEHFYTWLFCISFQIKVLFPPSWAGPRFVLLYTSPWPFSVLDRGWELRLWHWFCILIPAVWPWASHFTSLSIRWYLCHCCSIANHVPLSVTPWTAAVHPGFPVQHCNTVSISCYWDVK